MVGGPGALADALAAAARQAGVEIRTGAERRAHRRGRRRRLGRHAVDRRVDRGARRRLERRSRSARCSACSIRCISSPSSSGACRTSAPTARWRRSTTRSRRCRASPASTALGANEQAAALSGRIRLARNIDGIERAFDAAKYGDVRARAVDRADDPFDRRSGAGAGRRPRRVGVRAIRAVPPARHELGRRAREPRDRRDRDHRTLCARLPFLDRRRARSSRRSTSNATTASPAATSFTASCRSTSGSSPARRSAGRDTARRSANLFLCGVGTHPGTGLDGRSGALAAQAIVERAEGARPHMTTRAPRPFPYPLRPLRPLCPLLRAATRCERQRRRARFSGFQRPLRPPSERSSGASWRCPSRSRAREAHAHLTAEPHVAGSPRDRVLAEWVRDKWREYGLEQVEIVEHEVLLPYPTEVAGRDGAAARRRASDDVARDA